jgi:hypothetical protein
MNLSEDTYRSEGCAHRIERVVGYDGRQMSSIRRHSYQPTVLVFVFVVFVFERVVDVHAEDVIAVIVQFPYKVLDTLFIK